MSPPTREEEFELATRARAGDVKARKVLLESHMGHVWLWAHHFARRSGRFEAQEFLSAGFEGMAIALDKYDPERGARFLTYAAHWVRAYMFKLLYRPKHEKGTVILSEQTPLWHGDDGDEFTLADTLRSKDPSQEETTADRNEHEFTKRAIASALEHLRPRERFIVQRVHFDGLSLTDVGRELNLSRERIRQLDQKARLKLRQVLGEVPGLPVLGGR